MARVFVDGRVIPNQRVHVGHGHTNLDFVAGQGLGDGELIQVKGVIVVDWKPTGGPSGHECQWVLEPTPRRRGPAGAWILSSSASTAAEKSGSNPRSSIALWAMFSRIARCCWSSVCIEALSSQALVAIKQAYAADRLRSQMALSRFTASQMAACACDREIRSTSAASALRRSQDLSSHAFSLAVSVRP